MDDRVYNGTDILEAEELRVTPERAARRPAAALVVDPSPTARELMRFALAKRCTFVEVAGSTDRADQLLKRYHFDVLIIDASQPGIGWLRALHENHQNLPAILVGESDGVPTPLSEFIGKPISLESLLAAVERALKRSGSDKAGHDKGLLGRPNSGADIGGLIAQSEPMRGLITVIKRIAPRSSTVLLEGESGTGKEVVARFLHRASGRTGAFAPLNCGSISPELLESELFGHTKGAFTGAVQARQGLFSYANGGTVFLDEICEMPLVMQAKLLRVLEERAIRPVGLEQEQPVDVRIVAATNRNVADEVSKGSFREDLYYRLNVVSLCLPPLRERPSDIPHLVKAFARSLSQELNAPLVSLTNDDLQALQAYSWPGNVRELKNLVERATLLGMTLKECLQRSSNNGRVLPPDALQGENGYPDDLPLAEVEKRHVLKVLAASKGNKSEAARRLGVSRKTLERKVKEWCC